MLRANDWVPPVSRTASNACLERARPGNVQAFLECLALVDILREHGRSDHGALISKAESLLTETSDGRVALLAHWNAGDRRSRRAGAVLIARRLPTSGSTPPEVWVLCGDADPLVRKHGLEAVGRLASVSELRTWLPRLIRHHAVDVRRSTFSIAEARVPDLADELAPPTLFSTATLGFASLRASASIKIVSNPPTCIATPSRTQFTPKVPLRIARL